MAYRQGAVRAAADNMVGEAKGNRGGLGGKEDVERGKATTVAGFCRPRVRWEWRGEGQRQVGQADWCAGVALRRLLWLCLYV